MSDETRSAPPSDDLSVGNRVTHSHDSPADTGSNTGDELPDVPGYAVSRELARGGMGVVYQAVQTRLNRPVALKLVLGEDRRGTFLPDKMVRAAHRLGIAHRNPRSGNTLYDAEGGRLRAGQAGRRVRQSHLHRNSHGHPPV